jgi:hypothetical protein
LEARLFFVIETPVQFCPVQKLEKESIAMKNPPTSLIKDFPLMIVLCLIVGALAVAAAIPADAEMQAMKYDGYLADVLCAERGIALDGADMTTHPEKHTVACLKEPQCVASGLGIMIKGKDDKYAFTKFDKKGAELAFDLINKTQKKDAVMVEVTGQMKDGVINVETITEK